MKLTIQLSPEEDRMVIEAFKRARGAVSPPESGCRNRVAVEQPDDPLISSEDLPLPDQAKAEAGELYEAIERLSTKALHLDDMAAKEFRDVPDARRRCQIKAGVYRSVYMDLKRYLPTAVAQSGVDRVEECPRCHGEGVRSDLQAPKATTEPCPACKGTGETRERSESGNAEPSHPTIETP